jgi:hypothetical protein
MISVHNVVHFLNDHKKDESNKNGNACVSSIQNL